MENKKIAIMVTIIIIVIIVLLGFLSIAIKISPPIRFYVMTFNDDVYMPLADLTQDSSYCEHVYYEKRSCYFNIAKKQKDESICDIAEESAKEGCHIDYQREFIELPASATCIDTKLTILDCKYKFNGNTYLPEVSVRRDSGEGRIQGISIIFKLDNELLTTQTNLADISKLQSLTINNKPLNNIPKEVSVSAVINTSNNKTISCPATEFIPCSSSQSPN